MSKALFTRNQYTQEERDQFDAALMGYDQKNSVEQLIPGKKLSGTIISKSEKECILFAFGKCDITIPLAQKEAILLKDAKIGDKAGVIITSVGETKDGFAVVGSIADFYAKEMESYVQYCIENDVVLTGVPIDMNHAGYNVKININDTDIIFFMPHLLTSVNKLSDPQAIIGKEMEVMLDSFYREGNKNFVASHKKFLETLVPTAIENLSKGQECNGIVTGFREFGVFVQFDRCLTGMIHKSNLNEDTLKKLEQGTLVSGEPIVFYVKDIVRDSIFLTQVLKESLWDSIAVGQDLEGKISAIKDFGLMVQLDYETRGLLHLSVLRGGIANYSVGDVVNVSVVNVNKSKRQITLNLND